MARREMMGTRDFVQRYEDRALRKIAIKMNKEIWTFVGLYTVIALTRALRARRARPPEVAYLAALQPRAQRA